MNCALWFTFSLLSLTWKYKSYNNYFQSNFLHQYLSLKAWNGCFLGYVTVKTGRIGNFYLTLQNPILYTETRNTYPISAHNVINGGNYFSGRTRWFSNKVWLTHWFTFQKNSKLEQCSCHIFYGSTIHFPDTPGGIKNGIMKCDKLLTWMITPKVSSRNRYSSSIRMPQKSKNKTNSILEKIIGEKIIPDWTTGKHNSMKVFY